MDVGPVGHILPLDPRRMAAVVLVTSVYQKALNAYLYIPWNSCHSLNSKHAWVKGELIHYVRICSKESDFTNIQKDFLVRLRERGYPGRWLEGVFEEIRYKVERPTVLKPNTADTDIEDPALHVLKLTHNPVWDDIDLNPFWRELAETWTELEAGYPEFRFMASFKKPTALGDRLNTTNRDTLSTVKGNGQAEVLGSKEVVSLEQFSGHFVLAPVTVCEQDLWITIAHDHDGTEADVQVQDDESFE
ncbi:hypothetical protein B0H14DRAFT_3517257 [Mycena olivaceomarginata]|nr:hypothetical protein B0H14DRAFT_3517257 [Mycena olivaceomarginata]